MRFVEIRLENPLREPAFLLRVRESARHGLEIRHRHSAGTDAASDRTEYVGRISSATMIQGRSPICASAFQPPAYLVWLSRGLRRWDAIVELDLF